MNYENMPYNSIIDILEKEHWNKETLIINEKAKNVESYSAKPGETTLVIDIKCPNDQKILIRGTQNGDIDHIRDAYPIKLTLCDNSKNEISEITKIKILRSFLPKALSLRSNAEALRNAEALSKERKAEVRCFYADIRKNDYFVPRRNILLEEGEHLYIYVIGEATGPLLPDKAISKDHISFRIKADIFTLL